MKLLSPRVEKARTWEKVRVEWEKKSGDGVKRRNDMINVLGVLYSWYYFGNFANYSSFQFFLLHSFSFNRLILFWFVWW